MKSAALCVLLISVVWPMVLTTHSDDVIYASLQDGQNLATRINCQADEEQHFHYSSASQLWGSMGGEIVMDADVLLHCLGADVEGKFGNEALKYLVQISNLEMREGTERGQRVKRGATRDFFSRSWKKVKGFIFKMFGVQQKEENGRRVYEGDTPSAAEPEDEDGVFPSGDVYEVPFQLVQLANGSIPEIRFSENEVEDGRVRNFKRHLADAFATRLHRQPARELERSIMGEHTSTYNISVTKDKSSLTVAGLVSTSQPPDRDRTLIVVNKMVTEEDIVRFAPSGEALNDRDGMNLESQQTQVFRDGKMISSRGRAFLSLANGGGDKRRKKRGADPSTEGAPEADATSYINTHTTFDIQLRRRHRRSAKDRIHLEGHSFRAASREAEVEDHQKKKNLENIQGSVDFNFLLEGLKNGNGVDEEDKTQSITEILKEEINLNLDKEPNSVSNIIRKAFTVESLEEVRARNFTVFKDYLQLIAVAGGPTAEEIFLHFLGNSKVRSPQDIEVVADILSDISSPSPELLKKLGRILETEKDMGPISISLAHLASTSDPAVKSEVTNMFSRLLRQMMPLCDEDPTIIDVLEAVGNLKCDRITDRILEVSNECKERSAVQIAALHALRHSTFTENVGEWFEGLVNGGDCDVVREAVGSLMDKIQDQEMTTDLTLWPRFHFNKVDDILKSKLDNRDCAAEDVLLYFGKKKNSEANEIALNTPIEPARTRKKRRALWDDLNCREWTEDDRYNPIQKKEEFAADRATYNRRKSCLAFRKIGMKGANAEIYAGMFAGLKEPSDPPKYKLFTKFVSGFNFLGHQTEVGSFYFYLYSGKTKAYVRIMGRTRQEFTNEGCTPSELKYRPVKHIPLYLVSLANVQMSLGIHLSSRLAIDTVCPDSQVYQLQPHTDVRIGGEAMGTVGFIRGVANLGANFNYKLQFTFTPTPNMCLEGSHGYDPMNVNFETYFRLWNYAKEDWGRMRVWKPNFAFWELRRGGLKQWFPDTCIALQETSTADLVREME